MAPEKRRKTRPGVTPAVDVGSALVSLRAKLKACDPEVQHYVAALEAINLEQERKIGQLQAENMKLENRVKVFIEKYEKEERKTLAEFFADAARRLQKKGTTPGEETEK